MTYVKTVADPTHSCMRYTGVLGETQVSIMVCSGGYASNVIITLRQKTGMPVTLH